MEQLEPGDPQRIGGYHLLGRLGAGGMGEVYLARSARGRTVAVKLVRPELAELDEFRRRFRQEVLAAQRVGGHWTAPVLDADTEAAVPWVATGYVAGPSLHRVVARGHGPLPEHSVRVLAAGLGHALRDIHAAGLIHRDLKPSNVLLTIDGPRVIDFGIARALENVTDGGLTSTGAVIGSPGFMSPEQVRGERLTPACDVFSLGSVLTFAATGRLPFGSPDSGQHALMFRIAEEEPDLDELPEPLVELVTECLRKDPARRPTLTAILERTDASAAVRAGRVADTWLPGALTAELARHAVELLNHEYADESAPTTAAAVPDTAPADTAPVETAPLPSAPPQPADAASEPVTHNAASQEGSSAPEGADGQADTRPSHSHPSAAPPPAPPVPVPFPPPTGPTAPTPSYAHPVHGGQPVPAVHGGGWPGQGPGALAPQPYPHAAAPGRGSGAHRWLVVLAVVVLLLAGALVGQLLRNGSDADDRSDGKSSSEGRDGGASPGADTGTDADTTEGSDAGSDDPEASSGVPGASGGDDTAGAVPGEYLGTWRATFDNPGGGTNIRVLTIRSGEVGDTVASLHGHGPDHDCTWTATLRSAGPPLELNESEVTARRSGSCSPGEWSRLTLSGSGPDRELRRELVGSGGTPLTYDHRSGD
ncbi:protein kinase [Streptomyces sp. XM4193]|uniref:serine/threonine-protein kinase n=1 Tax=Streptomyces sp. XM4193 TaxID=2929782 RepID=UPI001FF7C3E2|nr:serine/threonine-protein kinase [Streptomyces sp. XM4193]MCK1795293.1 protein kinase [Streptomyces sp. XM4193]